MRLLLAVLWLATASPSGAASQPVSPPSLAAPTELLKLPKDDAPVITWAWPFVRVSPKGDRCVYIRKAGQIYPAMMLYIRTFGPPATEQAPPTAVPTLPICWHWAFSGHCWRADGLQVAYLLADKKDEMEGADPRSRLGVAVFDWDLPLPQQSGGGISKDSLRSHTAVSFAPSGKTLWRAESDLRTYLSCRIVGPEGVIYSGSGFAIYYLVPSPDGKHLAWVEQAPDVRKRAGAGAAAKEAAARLGLKVPGVPPPWRSRIVVMALANRKVLHRVELQQHCDSPPVWADGGKLVCYSDAALIGRIHRRELHALSLADGKSRLLVRDAKAVGAIGRWLVANRGPGCIPLIQLTSSFAPPPGTDPRPKRNEIVLIPLVGEAEPLPLIADAFAQQLLGRDLIYAEENGPDVIVWRATVR